MTFTSQLIVERSGKGSRASVKEQGKKTYHLVSMCCPGCPTSDGIELCPWRGCLCDGEGSQDYNPLLASLFPPILPVMQNSMPTVGMLVASLNHPQKLRLAYN